MIEKRNGVEAKPPLAYDDILREIGEFGAYQLLVGLTVGFVFAYGSFVSMNFVFSADTTEHRCWIPECEPLNSSNFTADWLERAIPHNDGRPDPCSRYEFIGSADGTCSEHNFNRSQTIACDGFVSKNNEQLLLAHLGILCTGQNNQMALLGTASSLGRALAMPIIGLLSDKFGRLITITMSALLGTLFSILQALPSRLMTFELYLALEMMASLTSTGLMGAGFVYNMEWTSAKYRVRITTISLLWEIVLQSIVISLAAWYFAENFVVYRMAVALPGLLVVPLHFMLGESPQWLLAQSKYGEAIGSLSKAAKLNRRPLSVATVQRIEQMAAASPNESADKQSLSAAIRGLLQQKALAVRLLITSLVWMFIFFAYYGVIVISTKVHSNKYLSFTLIGLADFPGTMINDVLLNRVGRRWTVGVALAIYSVMLATSTQLPAEQEAVQLTLFILGKAAIYAAFSGFSTFSAEFWPTSIRNTASNIGAMAGRLGSILASVAVLLSYYHAHLPVFLNAAGGMIGAVLVFAFLPETMHCDKLPDTVEEALDIGKSTTSKMQNNNAEIAQRNQ